MTMITGKPAPDYNLVQKLNFGNYVQAYRRKGATNTPRARSVDVIALHESGNDQGGWYFISLATGKRSMGSVQYQWRRDSTRTSISPKRKTTTYYGQFHVWMENRRRGDWTRHGRRRGGKYERIVGCVSFMDIRRMVTSHDKILWKDAEYSS